jgi:hypothetical protein
MPLPTGIGFIAPGGGNVDFGLAEGISALQRHPQVRRSSGTGMQNLTGSVVYAIVPTSGSVTVTENTAGGATIVSALAAPLVVPFGIPTLYPPAGGALQITPSNLSTVFVLCLYK